MEKEISKSCHLSSTVKTTEGAIAILLPDVTSWEWLAHLVKLTIALRCHIHSFKMTEKEEQMKKRLKGGMFCIAPGCSNEFYRVKDQEKPVHFHLLPLKPPPVLRRWPAALKRKRIQQLAAVPEFAVITL